MVLVAAIAFWPKSVEAPPTTSAHDCWIGADGNLAGCRMFDGTLIGDAIGSPTTCYFVEPLPSGDYGLSCKR